MDWIIDPLNGGALDVKDRLNAINEGVAKAKEILDRLHFIVWSTESKT
jgi:hypothetical protein